MGARFRLTVAVVMLTAATVVSPLFGSPGSADAVDSPVATDPATDRVIVFFDGGPVPTSELNAATNETDLSYVRSVSREMRVYRTPRELSPRELSRLNEDLSALPNVTEVRPDSPVVLDAISLTDPYYATHQSDLYGTYGINVEPAWSITKGSGVNVAVIDSGILMNHPDLSANIVGGYDFVSANDDGSFFSANDGNGWDSDASDPGDWGETDAEYKARTDINPNAVRRCAAASSSWHGSHVSGTIAAPQNNGVGITGVAPSAKIIPVRALGRCGGWTSDLLAAMRWAAGLTVTGAPTNPNPARILNMSLGAPGTDCSGELANTVNAVAAAGALVVAAAGNENIDASRTFPANCANALAVSSVSGIGARSAFSNYGSVVDIAAPGEAILSTTNTGLTIPVSYTYRAMNGTSMATPHVAGVAALALAVNPGLTVTDLRSVLTGNVKAFAPDPNPAPAPGDTKYPTCNMSKACGAGIVNAGAAVTFASQNIRPGAPTNVLAVRDKTNVTVTWTAPSNTGSSAITRYVVQANGNDSCTTPNGTTLTCTVFALAPGTYTFTVQAVNATGAGPASAASGSVSVVAPPSPAQNVSALRSGQSVTVSWSVPTSTGGLPVEYVVSGGPSGDVTTSNTSTTFTGLTGGTTYTFAVTARNAEGSASPVSAAPVTVYSPPSAARNVAAVRTGQSVTVTWATPDSTGGLPLTYTVSAGPGGSGTTSSLMYTFDNLAPGIVYTFWVTAQNTEGSAFAEPSSPVWVYSPPSNVRNAVANATTSAITVSWSAPLQTGGLPVEYVVSGGPTGDVTAVNTSYTFTSALQGVAYSFSIVARNSEGTSVAVHLPSVSLLVPTTTVTPEQTQTTIPPPTSVLPPPPTVPPTTVAPSTTASPPTTVKPLPRLTKLNRGSTTLLTRIFKAPAGSTVKWYAAGTCYIRSTKVVATRIKGTCKLTALSTLAGVKTRSTFSLKVV